MRRFVIIVGVMAAVFAVVVLASPFWLGAVISRVGGSFGLTHGGYERMGYARFALREVEIRRPGVRVWVERGETYTPVVWLWRRATGQEVKVSGAAWRVEVEPGETKKGASKPRGWVPLREQLMRIAGHLDRWVPEAEAGPGVVTWRNGELIIASATWSDRTVKSPAVSYRALTAAVAVKLKEDGAIDGELSAPEHDAALSLRSGGAEINGRGTWWGQDAELSARFDERGWRPLEALLHAEGWEISGERVRLGAHYATIHGRARVEWKDGDLRADISAESVPVENAKAPPLKVDLRGHGEAGVFVAEALDVSLPGVAARLDEPVSIDRTGRVRSSASRFTFDVDLARLPWISAHGAVRGEGAIGPNEEGRALINFSVAGESLAWADTTITEVAARGALDWPRLTVDRARVVGAGASELALSGGWDFRRREVLDASARGEIRYELLKPWLPENLQFDALTVDARASGAWETLAHHGTAQVERFRFNKINPAAVALTWRGELDRIADLDAHAVVGQTKIVASGSGDRAGLMLATLELTQDEATLLRLTEPAAVQWGARRQIGPVRLLGPDARLDASLTMGEAGRFDLTGRGVKSDWLRDLLALPAVSWQVDTLALWGEWDRGPATYAADAELTVGLGQDRTAHVSVQMNGAADGLRLNLLRASEGQGVIVNASGHLPLVLNPTEKPLVQFDENAPLSLDAATSPNPEFWEKFTQLTGLELVRPEAKVHLGGTWAHPNGEAQLSADRLEAVSGKFKDVWPRIESLQARLTGDGDGVKLEQFSLAVNGQAVRVQGWLPVSPARWREFVDDPRAAVRHGDLRVEVPDAELAALARHFPAFLAPTGRVSIDLTIKPDATISGYLKISDATSRPLGPLGVLQEINADMRFEGRTVEFASVTARMAGQLVTLQGRAALPEEEPVRLDLALKGENLPFVRRTGLLLRGNLDLKLVTASNGQTTISGKVGLRDSLFLSDVRSLIPTGAKGSAARPPYFSIEAEPLNAWRLEVEVAGERFMQLRTPVFNGTASARFRLTGTLGNPRASGEAVIDQGNVRLPFANFEVRQGYVRLGAEQLEPQIFVTGATRRYGYDVRMELSGPATAPNLTFSSSPPLDAEQVLLMVMAGQAPKDEITTTDRQRITRFGAFFGQSLLGTLGGDSSGADRLTLTSGENISEQGRETYNIEYRLDDRWSLTGEYDEFDEYYGGLRWRIFTKGGSADEAK